MRRLLPLALAGLLALSLLPGLAAVDALDWREARDLVVAGESTTRHEWLTPSYANEPFFEKPLAAYAPEILARRVVRRIVPASRPGASDVAVSRAVRAAFAAALALLLAAIGTRAFGARAGWLAACALASMIGLPLVARADGGQLFATLTAWFGIGQLLEVVAGRARARDRTLLAGWLALAAAGVIGGPVSALWPLAGFALYSALARRYEAWHSIRPLAGLTIILGAALPWYGGMAAIHGWPFVAAVPWFPYAAAGASRLPAGPLLAISSLVVASFPWTPLLGAALGDAAWRLRAVRAGALPALTASEHEGHLVLALLFAGVLPVALYAAPPMTAVTPALPAIALLIGRYTDRVLDGLGDARTLGLSAYVLAASGTVFGLSAVALAPRVPEATDALRLLGAAVFLAAWAPALAHLRRAPKFAVALFALPTAIGAPLLLDRVLPGLEPWLNTHLAADVLQRVSPPHAPLVLVEPPPPSLRQSLPRNFILRNVPSELADVAARDGQAYLAFRPLREHDVARVVPAPLEILVRTPTLVIARVHIRPPSPLRTP